MSDLRADRAYYKEEATAFAIHALVLGLIVSGMVWLAFNVRHREELWVYYLVGGLCAIVSAFRAIQMLGRAARAARAPRQSRPSAKPRNKLAADHRSWKVRMNDAPNAPRRISKIEPDSPLARSWAKLEQERHLEEVKRKGLSHRHLRH